MGDLGWEREGPEEVRTLADRATHAAGRMLERYATTAARIVPRDALLAVGTFDFREGRIRLTGPDSERTVAAWLGTPRLDPAELAQGVGRAARAPDAAHPPGALLAYENIEGLDRIELPG